MPANPVIRIVLKNKDPFVRPASEVSEKIGGVQGKITFKNRTNDKAIVHLPANVFVGEPNDFSLVLDEKSLATHEKTLTVDAGAKTALFTYRVYCAQTQTFAQGNSDPEFIIEN